MSEELSVDDLTPHERRVFLASCQLKEEQLLHDPVYEKGCEHLAELGWLERVYVERVERHGEEREIAGYRLSKSAATAHNLQSLIEEAKRSTN